MVVITKRYGRLGKLKYLLACVGLSVCLTHSLIIEKLHYEISAIQ